MALVTLYGTPNLLYVARDNVTYTADGNGRIANVDQIYENDLIAKGCMSQANWLLLSAAHPTGDAAGTAGAVQMSDGAGGFLASQITDNGTTVKIANGQIVTPAATPITLVSDTGVTLGSPTGGVKGQDTLNAAAGLFSAGVEVPFGKPMVLTGQTSTPGTATGTLTNAPAAGNAQTWLQISINGVTHWIPAWHA